MRCDKCRHWEMESKYRNVEGVGLCRKAVQLWDATVWNKDAEGDIDRVVKPELIGQMSFVQDGSDYHASLWTKAEFFCAHFEQP